MAEGEPKTGPEQRGYRSQNYREITPDYVFGGVKTGYIEMIIVTTKLNAYEKVISKKDVIEHTEEIALKITPIQAKSMVTWLLQNIKLYENAFGKIPNVETDEIKQDITKRVEDLLATI
jgi:hypothetical protein